MTKHKSFEELNEERRLRHGGALVLYRRPGRGLFIGRKVRVTVTALDDTGVGFVVEVPLSLAVNGLDVGLAAHLAAQADREADVRAGLPLAETPAQHECWLPVSGVLRIGRSVTLQFLGNEAGRAALRVEAPSQTAVTRDDFTFADHLKVQEGRERHGASEV